MEKMKIRTLLVKFLSITMILFIWAGVASAHKLSVFAYIENNTLVGEAYFNDGAPVRHSAIHVSDTENNLIAEGTTDEKGQFSIPIDITDLQSLLVSVNGGMGHMGQTVVTIDTAEPDKATEKAEKETNSNATESSNSTISLSEENISALMQEIVQKEMAPLRNELFLLRKEISKPKLSEIIGGIGYIVGLVGVALWVGGRKKYGQQ
jgi:nickel transport protein